MAFVTLYCPKCSNQVKIESEKEFCFCSKCGTKIINVKMATPAFLNNTPPVQQPVQRLVQQPMQQPVQRPVQQQVYQAPVQQQYRPAQPPVYQQPVYQPPAQPPVMMPIIQQPPVQPVQRAATKPSLPKSVSLPDEILEKNAPYLIKETDKKEEKQAAPQNPEKLKNERLVFMILGPVLIFIGIILAVALAFASPYLIFIGVVTVITGALFILRALVNPKYKSGSKEENPQVQSENEESENKEA